MMIMIKDKRITGTKLMLALLIMLGTSVLQAQDKGIQFEHLSWEQTKTKAKTENKYIFVDCYASWCAPCKAMDNSVYSKDAVGETVNPHFISLKLQMDISKDDDDEIKSHYGDAKQLNKTYEVTAYPTLLFFSPKGELVYKSIGAMIPNDFITMVKNAQDPSYQYPVLAKEYRSIRGNYDKIPALLDKVLRARDQELAKTVEEDYLHNYLDKLSLDKFATKEHIEFGGKYLGNVITSKDRIFQWFYKHGDKIDSVMHNNDCANHILVNFIIRKEEILPKVTAAEQSGSDPDWEQISQTIQNKYGQDYITYNMVSSKMKWYFKQKKYVEYAHNLAALMGLSDIKISNDWYGLNQAAWDIFSYSQQKDELEQAITWIERALQIQPEDYRLIDTKANLLYKLGRKENAIILEQKAALLSSDKQMQATLEKMQKGEQTWDNH